MTEEVRENTESLWWKNPLWIVVAVGGALRLFHLGSLSLWYDESTSILGGKFVDWSFTFLTASESRLVPMFSVMAKVWYFIGESLLGITMGNVIGDGYLRLLPCLFSIALIPMTYALAMYLFKRRGVALVAAAGIAISPLQVYYAQEYRPHSIYAFLVCLGVYCSLRALDGGTRRWWIATVLVGICSVYTYYFSAFYLVCMNIYALTGFTRYRDKIKPWSISQVLIAGAVIPPALMASRVWSMHTSAEEHWFPHPTIKTVLYTIKNFLVGYSPNVPLYWTLFFIASALIALGMYSIRRQALTLSLLLCASFVPILLQVVIWSTQDFAFFTYRIQLAFAPAVYIFLGLGVSALPKKGLQVGVSGLIVVLTAFALSDHYAQRLHPVWNHVIGARYKIENRPAAAYVKEGWKEGDSIAHFCTLTLPPFRELYFPTPRQSVVSLNEEHQRELLVTYPDEKMWETIGFMPRLGKDILAESSRVWYVESWWEYGQPFPRLDEYKAWFDEQATLVDQRSFDGITVYLYETGHSSDSN